jgi:preprotein translocase subunit SecE
MRAYLREVRGEMKKVTWPSKNDMIKTTIAVIVISLFFGIYLFGVDFIFSHIFRQIGSIFQ